MAVAFPTIAIIGSGAIGLYYGTRLGLGGADVRFLLRRDYVAVKARGSVLARIGEQQLELRTSSVYRDSAQLGAVDLVIVALKATANAELPSLLLPLLRENTTILTLQNGLGSDEFLARLFGRQRVIGGLAFIALTRTGPGEVACYHPGSITMGEFGGPIESRTRALAAQFEAAGVRVTLVDRLLEARWRKLVWNIPFNGLAVANDMTTDRLCATPALADEVRTLMREVQRAAAAFDCAIPDSFLQEQFDVTPPMGAYQPSSLVDYRARREVEVEAIWGEPLRRAEAKGVAVPKLAALYQRLKTATSPKA